MNDPYKNVIQLPQIKNLDNQSTFNDTMAQAFVEFEKYEKETSREATFPDEISYV